jgi:ribonucleoside-diphosphate reductase alpha chain
MNQMEKMFAHKGKSSKKIGATRTKIYKEMYDYISSKQKNNELPFDGNYLDENELAKNIYEKKYFLKDLDNKLIEKNPEDVFKRLSSFLAAVEGTKSKQKEWAKKILHRII